MECAGNNVTIVSNYTTGLHGLKWAYGIIIPISCLFGILGNLLTICVLLSNKKKFTSFIFAYMKGLAIVDIFQISFTFQVVT